MLKESCAFLVYRIDKGRTKKKVFYLNRICHVLFFSGLNGNVREIVVVGSKDNKVSELQVLVKKKTKYIDINAMYKVNIYFKL